MTKKQTILLHVLSAKMLGRFEIYVLQELLQIIRTIFFKQVYQNLCHPWNLLA